MAERPWRPLTSRKAGDLGEVRTTRAERIRSHLIGLRGRIRELEHQEAAGDVSPERATLLLSRHRAEVDRLLDELATLEES